MFPDFRKLLHKKAEWIWKFLSFRIIRKKLIFERKVPDLFCNNLTFSYYTITFVHYDISNTL